MTTGGIALERAEGTANRRNAAGLRAWLLVAPLVAFIGVTFVAPLGFMLVRSVHTPLVADTLPETIERLRRWDGEGVPGEDAFVTAAWELLAAHEARAIGRVATHIGRMESGLRGVIVRTARGLRDMDSGAAPTPASWRNAMMGIDGAWGDRSTWVAIRRAGERYTARHYLNAVDLDRGGDGRIVARSADLRIYLPLLGRTLLASLVITLACLALGYPVAYLIAHAPPHRANLLLMLVLVPFWTSLLARTASWIVLLQSQGVINDLLVAAGLVGDEERVAMNYNLTGTIVAMTHVLLPFMVLPLYSVMRAIPRDSIRVATSLGSTFLQAFRRVYWPQTLRGVGAGSLLVFALAIGYYITPALVGGRSGQFIASMIAYHMQQSLDWGLAAALGGLLLATVAGLYFLFHLFDRIAGVGWMRAWGRRPT